MRKVLATSKGGRTLVAFGWVNVRIVDAGGVKAATVCDLGLRAELWLPGKAGPTTARFPR